jgi:hypothetical protein
MSHAASIVMTKRDLTDHVGQFSKGEIWVTSTIG